MRGSIKKISFLIILAAILSFILPGVNPLQDTMYNVQAATVKLNKSSVNLYVMGTSQLYIIGTKNKVSWYSNDTSIAKVTEKGKVTGISKGKTFITAKVLNKEYTCTINVRNKSATLKDIAYSVTESDLGLLVKLNNNSTEPLIGLQVSLSYYDDKNNLVYVEPRNRYFYQVYGGKDFYVFFEKPQSNNEPIKYSSYKIKVSDMGTINFKEDVTPEINVIAVDGFKDSLNLENGQIVTVTKNVKNLSVTNNSKEYVSSFGAYLIYYKDNEIVKIDEFTGALNIGTTEIKSYDRKSYDSDDIEYDDFEVLVNYAYIAY